MTDERVEPTKEWLDALIDEFAATHWRLNGKMEVLYGFRDAILASQPERVECPTKHRDAGGNRWAGQTMWGKPFDFCPSCGQSLKGAEEK